MPDAGAVLPDAGAVPSDALPVTSDAVSRAPSVPPAGTPRAGRRRSRGRKRRPRWQRLLLVAGGVGIIVAAGIGMSMQSPMPVADVAIAGASPDLQPQISSELAVSPGQSFSSIDTAAVADRIRAIDGIRDVDLRWSWWNTLTVSIAEQTPAGLLADGSGGFVVVDADAATIRTVPTRPAGLLLVEASDAESRKIGLQVAQQVPAEVAAVADAVVVEGPRAVVLRMASGATVVLGPPENVPVKLQLAQQLLTGTGAGAVNVSVPERPAVSQLPPPPQP